MAIFVIFGMVNIVGMSNAFLSARKIYSKCVPEFPMCSANKRTDDLTNLKSMLSSNCTSGKIIL